MYSATTLWVAKNELFDDTYVLTKMNKIDLFPICIPICFTSLVIVKSERKSLTEKVIYQDLNDTYLQNVEIWESFITNLTL